MYQAEEIKLLFIITIVIALLFLLSLVVVIILFRKNQNKILLKKELDDEKHRNLMLEKELEASKEKERISLDLHDDLGSTLSAIGLNAQLLQKKTQDKQTNKGLTEIIKYTEDLNLSIREIMWSLNTKNDNIQDFINYVKNYIDSYFENTGIQSNFSIPNKFETIIIDSYKRRQLYLIIKEICHNILKHSSATEISFEASLNENNLSLTIQDNGIGIPDIKKVKKGNGIQSIRKRVENINGKVAFENSNRLTVRINLTL